MSRDQGIGILGGGQLSRMLVQAAEKLGLKAIPLVDSSQSPAAQVSSDRIIYAPSYNDIELEMDALEKLFNQVGTVIFENEFVDCTLLALVSRDMDVQFVPRLFAIRTLQDKLSQKKILAQCGIPHARFIAYVGDQETDAALGSWIEKVKKEFPSGSVLKWSKFGYDGYGNFLLSKEIF